MELNEFSYTYCLPIRVYFNVYSPGAVKIVLRDGYDTHEILNDFINRSVTRVYMEETRVVGRIRFI